MNKGAFSVEKMFNLDGPDGYNYDWNTLRMKKVTAPRGNQVAEVL